MLASDLSFSEYIEAVTKYQNLADEIKYTCTKVDEKLITNQLSKYQIFIILGYYGEECNEWRSTSPRLSA